MDGNDIERRIIALRSLFWRKSVLEQKFRTDVYHKSITFDKCVNPGESSFVFRVNETSYF